MRLAAIDLGSNSFHLVVVEVHADGSFDTLVREKEMLRLGDSVARAGRFDDDDLDRIVDTVRRFVAVAASAGASEIRACATSAIRDAENGNEVVELIEAETGVAVEVVSGRREAELIFAAVRASVDLGDGNALCLDLGGGSLEVMVGNQDRLRWSKSVPLGVGRLTAELVRNDPLSAADVRRLRRRVEATLRPMVAKVGSFGPTRLVGTSATLCDLVRNGHPRQPSAGSVVLQVAMDLFGFDEMVAGEWALREGLVLEAIRGDGPGDAAAIRRSSVLGLARRCRWDEGHGRQVARLAVALFDGTAALHRLAPSDRELLEHAALLHDIGEHVAVDGHHKHTAYLIEHGRLRGFGPADVDVLCVLGRYHRRGDPKPAFEPFARLRPQRRAAALALLALLRLADGLDRGHAAAVEAVEVEVFDDRVRLVLTANDDVDVEVWGLRRKRQLFEAVFDRRVDVVAADHPAVATRRCG